MHLPARSLRYSYSIFAVLAIAGQLVAAPASDTILPKTTKGFVSVAKPSDFEDRWNKTQFGKLLDDELMQPFVKDLRKQLEDEYQAFEEKLGIEWDSLDGVPAGEMSLSLIERQGEDAAIAITIDVTGHDEQAKALLASIEKNFAARGGKKETTERDGAAWHVFTVPGEAGSPPQTTVYFSRDNILAGIDDPAEAEAMLKRIAQAGKDNLASVPAYQAVMKKLRDKVGNVEPEARWFVEPFGFLFAARTLQKESITRRAELDYIKIFSEQGFDAIQGAGGFLNQLPAEGVELVLRIAVYAPPAPGKENDPLRWNLSMRMLQTPNVPAFEPQSWVPRMSASYTTVHINMMDAFDNLGPLVNALEDHEDAWENSLKGWKEDAFGPKVDVREEFIANLGNRVTIVTGYDVPISADSERAVFAIEAKNEKALAETLEKWMSREPGVEKRLLGQYVVWERVTSQEAVEDAKIDVPGFESLSDPDDAAAEEEEDRERVLPNSAVTVALGQLLMASDIKYLEELLAGFGQSERLASSADYRQVMAVVEQLMPGERTALHFGRSDEEFRPTYELIRQGKMPEAETMFGKVLNKVLTTEKEREDGVLREQQIDGSTLPSFEAVRRYFGPHGRVTRAEPDGWFLTEVLLNKEAP